MNDFEEYIRQGEPLKREKGYAWQTAIGLQAVDDLKPSEYLIQTARLHIEGDITIEEAKQLIDSYYQSKTIRTDIEDRTEEADKVSARIAEILSEKTFTFSPVEYITIHRRLFKVSINLQEGSGITILPKGVGAERRNRSLCQCRQHTRNARL